MKKSLLYFLTLVFLSVPLLHLGAQTNTKSATSQTQTSNDGILKPKVIAMDFIFVNQMLNTVELKATEVDALIEVKETLKPFLEKIKSDNVPLNQTVTFDIRASVALNMLRFLERGSLVGSEAEKYKRFVDGMVAAAQEITNNKK